MIGTKSFILQTSTRYLKYMLIAFSVFLFWRGHNSPGGGFVGGLMAASALILHAFAFGVEQTRKSLWCDPRTFIGMGLLFAISSGIISFFKNDPFMSGQWTEFHLPMHMELALGTPVLFDLGVYFVVMGVAINIIFALLEE